MTILKNKYTILFQNGTPCVPSIADSWRRYDRLRCAVVSHPRGASVMVFVNRRIGLAVTATICCWSMMSGSAAAQTNCSSPTGHTPKLMWTPQRHCIWNRMRDEHHPWFQIIVANADGQRYSDLGRWETLAFQITGDKNTHRPPSPISMSRSYTSPPILISITFANMALNWWCCGIG